MKVILFATCLWHTTLVHKGMPNTEVDLINRPWIGQKIHVNGRVWKVKESQRLCGGKVRELAHRDSK